MKESFTWVSVPKVVLYLSWCLSCFYQILLLLRVNQDTRRNVEKYIFFSSRKTSNSRFFTLYPPLMDEAGLSHALLPGFEEQNLDRNPTISSLSSSKAGHMQRQEILNWYTEESLTQISSEQDVTYVRDMILINHKVGQQLLLIACGSAPHATIRRQKILSILQPLCVHIVSNLGYIPCKDHNFRVFVRKHCLSLLLALDRLNERSSMFQRCPYLYVPL